MRKHTLIRLFLVCLLLASSIQASADDIKVNTIVDAATNSVNNFTVDPNMTWFRDNVGNAKGLLIIPQLVKGGFVFGGSGGSGVLLVKGKGNIWTDPAFYTMGSGTFGFQIGIEVSEIILMVMTDRGVNAMLNSSFKLGGDASIAAGPIGGGAKAQLADILAFSRTKGVYAGINLEGAVIKIRQGYNDAYYGETATPRTILIEQTSTNPHADKLRNAVANLALKSSASLK